MNINSRSKVILYSTSFLALLLFAIIVYAHPPSITAIGDPRNNSAYSGTVVLVNITTNITANFTINITNGTSGAVIARIQNITLTNALAMWNTSNGSYPDGSYNITIYVSNNSNDTGQGDGKVYLNAIVNLTVDNTAPTITSVSVASVNSTTAVIRYSTTGDASNSTIRFRNNNSVVSFLGAVNNTGATYVVTHSVFLGGLNDSTLYIFNITACDDATGPNSNNLGNCNTTNTSYYYNFTTASHVSAVNNPTNSSVPTNDTVTVTGTAINITINITTDIPANLTISLWQAANGSRDSFWNSNGNTTHIITWNVSNGSFVDGLYNITVNGTSSTNESKEVTLINAIKTFNVTLYNVNIDNASISTVAMTDVTDTTATITWTTTGAISNSSVNYSTSIPFSASVQRNSSSVKTHSVALSGLTSNTKYYFNITSCNVANTCNMSRTYNFTTSVATPPGGGGGGGGGGGKLPAEQASIETGFAKTETVFTGGSFSFSKGGSSHKVKLDAIDYVGKTVTITVSSTPQQATLEVGQSETFDVNDNGKDDLRVTVVEIKTVAKAVLKFESISEKATTAVTTPTEEETGAVGGEQQERTTTRTPIQQQAPAITNTVWMILGAVIVVVLILYFSLRKKKR